MINVNFGTFRRAVNYVGGVYVDIDRDYFNDNSGGGERYAAIDINPGYQKLMGQDALDYVRYRHTDNDFIRAARQQDFLRQARGQAGVRKLVAIGDRKRLARVFGRYFEVDKSFRSTKEILSMLKLALYLIQENPSVNEVRFRAGESDNPSVDTRLFASQDGLDHHLSRVHEREGVLEADQDRQADEGRRGVRAPAQEAQPQQARLGRRAGGVQGPGRRPGRAGRPEARLPVLLPDAAHHRRRPTPAPSRASTRSATSSGKKHKAYRLVLSKGLAGEYYGVQGMTWKDAADPRRRPRDADRQRAQAAALLRRQARCAWSRGAPSARSTGCPTRSRSRSTPSRCSPSPTPCNGSSSSGPLPWSARMSSLTDREPIGVIGTGYVGLVTAAGFAELGHDVWCIDIDEAKIRGLQEGRIPIWEPACDELVQRHRDRLHFSTDLADALEHARLLFVAVGTPPTYSGDADLSAVYAVVDAMPASDRHALVMKSTVPVGTGEAIKRRFAERGKGGFSYVSCPEFLKEGSAVKDFLTPDRVVVGDEGDWAGDAVVELYAPLEAPLVRTDIKSAEMVKLASNAFLATKISFINEIANVCEETGADVVEVARGMGLDDRIGPKFLQAGIGFGGSCFPKDVAALKQLAGNSGYHFQLLNSVIEVNELQKRRVIAKLHKHLGSLVGKEIGLLGLAFKPNTDDMREASSLVLSARLQAAGARVRVYDPVAEAEARKMISGVVFAGSALEVADGADAVVLVTEWPEFADIDLAELASVMRGDLLVDGRNFLDPASVHDAGLAYEGIGRPARNGRRPETWSRPPPEARLASCRP